MAAQIFHLAATKKFDFSIHNLSCCLSHHQCGQDVDSDVNVQSKSWYYTVNAPE